MKIEEILQENCIQTALAAQDKNAVIHELSKMMADAYPGIDETELDAVLNERERLGSTGIGHGIAILHGKMATLEGILTGFGRSAAGIDFDAQDGQPVHLFFCADRPEELGKPSLKGDGTPVPFAQRCPFSKQAV